MRNTNNALLPAYFAGGKYPLNATKRECGVAAACVLVAAVAQAAKFFDVAGGPIRCPTPDDGNARAIATWHALFVHNDATIELVSNAMRPDSDCIDWF